MYICWELLRKRPGFLAVIYFFTLFFSLTQSSAKGIVENSDINKLYEINLLSYGAKGDGVIEDTVAVQRAFNKCSKFGWACKVPSNKTFLITGPLFLWGKASLIGEDGTGGFDFKVLSSPFLLNLGIAGKNKIKEPFSGNISAINFKVSAGKKGRIMFFWRTQGAHIIDNIFEVGNYRYSATSSGNINSWLKQANLYIRKDIVIKRNKIMATADYLGSEGIGLGDFDGAVISDNTIIGVGDDPIGVHYSKNIKIENNVMKSVDSRLYVSNSINVEIRGNVVERMASPLNNRFYKGIALIYVGFELYDKKNSLSAPTNINVYDNSLYYPAGAIDAGAGIYLYAPRNVRVGRNNIVNDSESIVASAIHLLPARFSKKWTDPDNIDKSNIARVWDVSIYENIASGRFPQKIKMTGKCINYMGKVTIRDNLAKEYQLYCPKVESNSNKKHVTENDVL